MNDLAARLAMTDRDWELQASANRELEEAARELTKVIQASYDRMKSASLRRVAVDVAAGISQEFQTFATKLQRHAKEVTNLNQALAHANAAMSNTVRQLRMTKSLEPDELAALSATSPELLPIADAAYLVQLVGNRQVFEASMIGHVRQGGVNCRVA